jgi:hypothetical protein
MITVRSKLPARIGLAGEKATVRRPSLSPRFTRK